MSAIQKRDLDASESRLRIAHANKLEATMHQKCHIGQVGCDSCQSHSVFFSLQWQQLKKVVLKTPRRPITNTKFWVRCFSGDFLIVIAVQGLLRRDPSV